uniref:Uncharacterized protein n=1 Tax=Plectus sambesii TaxID=2011161 RepID=A0A914XGB5_9BILA
MAGGAGIRNEEEYHLIIETENDDNAAADDGGGGENALADQEAVATNGQPGHEQASHHLGIPRDSRQRALSASAEDSPLRLLGVEVEEPRRRSFDDRGLRPGTGRKLPRALTDTNSYYVSLCFVIARARSGRPEQC